MTGANIPINIALGRVAEFTQLAAANDAVVWVPLEATGLEADAALRDHNELAALLAGTSNEQTTMGRKSSTSATVTVDDTNERTDIDTPDQTWVAATGNPLAAALICWDGDTTTGTDANIIPMSKHSFDVTPDGSDITGQTGANGFYRAAG